MDDNTVTNLCTQCLLPIPVGAKICTHCHSHQNWQGRLAGSSTVLALLVALVSVLSTALPAISIILHRPASKTIFTGLAIRGEELFVVATNSGDRPSVFQQGSINRIDGDPDFLLELIPGQSPILMPGSNELVLRPRLRFNIKDGEALAASYLSDKQGRDPKIMVELIAAEYNGANALSSIPTWRSNISLLIYNHVLRCKLKPSVQFVDGCQSASEVEAQSPKSSDKR